MTAGRLSNSLFSLTTLKKNYFCSYKGMDGSKKYNRPEVPVACEPINSGFVIEKVTKGFPFISRLSTTISSSETSLDYVLSLDTTLESS